MSYTLRGRIESRAAALLPVLVAACALAVALERWWPVELALLMTALGLALDALLYDRLLAYQPGWLSLPLGLLELVSVMAAARALGIEAPLWPALGLFWGGWLVAQVLGHAGFPFLRLSYAEDGGELGRLGLSAAATVTAIAVGSATVAWVRRPPVVHLDAGVHQGPLVLTKRQVLEGEPGTIVRGGIVVRASGVTIRDVGVVGGLHGIDVDDVDDTVLDGVSVSGSELDGIHVRMAAIEIRDCRVDMTGNEFGQGIDISFAAHRGPSTVEGCTVTGGQEGIVTHSATAHIVGNHVSRTTLRGIAMTEMSMGMIAENEVRDALGIGILCNDYSHCHIEQNVVVGTRPDHASQNLWRRGYGVLVSFGSDAELDDNRLGANPLPAGAVLDSEIEFD